MVDVQIEEEEQDTDEYDPDSMSSDSDFEVFEESDGGLEDDDALFENLDDDTDNTNELDSHSSSDTDDDGRKQKKKKHAIFNEEADILNPVFSVGMEFKTHEIFRDAVKEHSIKLGKKIKFKKSDRAKVCAVCEGKEDCPWYIYASFVKNDGLYRIKRYVDQHTCTRSYHVPWVSTKWIVKRYSDKICKNPTWPIQSLAETIESENTVNVDRQKVFRARRRSLAILEGDAKQQFRELFGYIDEVRSTNPGTTIKVKCKLVAGSEHEVKFKRLYICWG
ncbi:hypothetical protein RHMOL_Rhmol02G0282000 [Rhododendron molle]|uniref:Uncharacterized protein n=1 Tax=Rhododendron molle TaxID=49168 RepID=A0ACC0PWD9_RHOML|nr:hypothetical protein RHMOL_Rhmol02G0282000 [Rhododendron molle]